MHVPTFRPIKTFPKRLIRKLIYIAKNIVFLVRTRLGFSGARIVGITPCGNTLLQLNKNYALGCKGTVLELPRDRVIYEYVKNRGSWELEESEFLARGLKMACRQPTSTALLDI